MILPSSSMIKWIITTLTLVQSDIIHDAASSGDLDEIRDQIENGVDVNMKDENRYNETPLHHAAGNGHTDTVRCLVNERANVEAQANFNVTPLHYAAAKDHTDTVRCLVNELGANVEAQTNWNDTPLHDAAANGHTNTVRCLVNELGANVDAQNRFNRTPLHRAARFGYTNTVRCLVNELGANLEAQDQYGTTPLSDAESKQEKQVILLLIELKADIAKRVHGEFPINDALNNGTITENEIANIFNNFQPKPFVTNEEKMKFSEAFESRDWEKVMFMTNNVPKKFKFLLENKLKNKNFDL